MRFAGSGVKKNALIQVNVMGVMQVHNLHEFLKYITPINPWGYETVIALFTVLTTLLQWCK